MTGPVILVDDDPDLRRATAQALKLAAFEVEAVDGAEAALAARGGQRLPPYKVPVRYVVRDDLPKLATGKVDKRQLRALAADAPAG